MWLENKIFMQTLYMEFDLYCLVNRTHFDTYNECFTRKRSFVKVNNNNQNFMKTGGEIRYSRMVSIS